MPGTTKASERLLQNVEDLAPGTKYTFAEFQAAYEAGFKDCKTRIVPILEKATEEIEDEKASNFLPDELC